MSNQSALKILVLAATAFIGLTSCQPTDELSSEANITSFTFDSSVEANSIVTSVPVIGEDNSISFNVAYNASESQLAALVPTIILSENATVSPESGSTVDFSKGAVTFTVTAQDGVTTKAYTAQASYDKMTSANAVGTYNGDMEISLAGADPTTQAASIQVAEVSETAISLTIADFSFSSIELGNLTIDSCPLTETENGFSFTGKQTLNLEVIPGMDPMPCDINITTGAINSDGTMTINIDITVMSVINVSVTFEGTKAE